MLPPHQFRAEYPRILRPSTGPSTTHAPAYSNWKVDENDEDSTSTCEEEYKESHQSQESDRSSDSKSDFDPENSDSKEEWEIEVQKGKKTPNANQATPSTSARQRPSAYVIQHTISDDRSRGSEFDVNNCILAALHKTTANTEIPILQRVPFTSPNQSGYLQSYPDQTKQRLFIERWKNHALNSNCTNKDPSVSDALRVIQKSLNIPDEVYFTIETLREHALALKAIHPRVQLIHRVSLKSDTKMYLDSPRWNISSYVSKNPEISCIIYRDYDGSTMLSSPYLPIFHTRGNAINTFLETLSDTQNHHFQLFLSHILTEYNAEYELVDEMTSKGLITHNFIKYLFKPGDVVVQGSHQDSRGYLCTTWLEKEELKSTKRLALEIEGKFSRERSTLSFEIDNEYPHDKVINKMDIRPLAYVDESTKERLECRGYWFWKCRVQHMVSYHEGEGVFQDTGRERYMVDMKVYGELHKSKGSPVFSESKDALGLEALQRDNPPDENFIFLAPPTIKGFNLKRKKWLDLQIDKIKPVIWNKQAFQHLVIKEKTKRLIQALVSNQIEAENSTDLITGKGNGLIMLLHGGPGTGKTLIAESVAEIAEKPLYPVTCGDIGTEPHLVENYLESVLHLGNTWDCVVLLDEADVFLEQRGLEDLRRNALVSVFLRVLEYYDGILILTSNRVGTFDEAFKSRIQLALHYKNLSENQRSQIWSNFLSNTPFSYF
ncbi:hypothetical protein F4825DRAFT_467828 [Nemania diffusa]|nr:hypothetical protein F4825DRAFT_467828 [Nemania diffusa]